MGSKLATWWAVVDLPGPAHKTLSAQIKITFSAQKSPAATQSGTSRQWGKKKLCRARRFAVRPRTRRRPRRHRLPEQSGGGRRSRLPSYRDHEARGAREEATSTRRCRRGARRLRRRRWRGRTPRPERPPGSPPSRPSTRSTSSAPASKVTPPLGP